MIISSPRAGVMQVYFDAGLRRAGTVDGDNHRGVLPLGQIGGIITDTPTVAEVINRMVLEADQAAHRLGDKLHGQG